MDEFLDFLRLDEHECLHRGSCFGRYGMIGCFWYNGIKLHYGDYCILDMSGSGCRTLETLYNNEFDWAEFIKFLLDHGGHVSRLDVAVDDLEDENNKPILKFSRMLNSMRDKKYISRAHNVRYMDGSVQEILIGSPASDKLVRIYNKALERGFGSDKHWIRVELQLRNDCALQFLMHWIREGNNIGQVFGGTLLSLFRFTTKSYDNQHSNRYITAPFWEKFCCTTEKLKNIKIGGLPYNEYNLINYLSVQASSSLKTYLTLCRGDITPLLNLADEAKLNEKQKVLLELYKNTLE